MKNSDAETKNTCQSKPWSSIFSQTYLRALSISCRDEGCLLAHSTQRYAISSWTRCTTRLSGICSVALTQILRLVKGQIPLIVFADSFGEDLKDRRARREQESCMCYSVSELSLVAEMGHAGGPFNHAVR